jgi:hypothetical protein
LESRCPIVVATGATFAASTQNMTTVTQAVESTSSMAASSAKVAKRAVVPTALRFSAVWTEAKRLNSVSDRAS